MIYLVSILSGLANGMFTCGAGQIIIFYLVFIMKNDTHKSRATSIAVLSCTSVISLIFYLMSVKVEISKCIVVIVASLGLGVIASKLMSKINSKYLNLISGVLMTVLSVISIVKG